MAQALCPCCCFYALVRCRHRNLPQCECRRANYWYNFISCHPLPRQRFRWHHTKYRMIQIVRGMCGSLTVKEKKAYNLNSIWHSWCHHRLCSLLVGGARTHVAKCTPRPPRSRAKILQCTTSHRAYYLTRQVHHASFHLMEVASWRPQCRPRTAGVSCASALLAPNQHVRAHTSVSS